MEQLPAELLQLICTFLDPVPDLLRLQLVNRRWASQCAVPSLWRNVNVPSKCFPSSYSRRAAWNNFAKRVGKEVQELHLVLPRTLRMSDHHHPLMRASGARCATLRDTCSICQRVLSGEVYICKLPSCMWSECEACKVAAMPLSLSSLPSLHTLSVRTPFVMLL